MKYAVVILALALGACSPDREVVEVYKGEQGLPGLDGRDGTSCFVTAAEGGANLSCSDGSSAFVANGLPGEQGPQGIPGLAGEAGADGDSGGAALLRDYSANSCTNIVGTSKYVKRSGSNYKLYSSSSCSSSSAFAEVSQGEAYWVSSASLAVHADSILRVITFAVDLSSTKATGQSYLVTSIDGGGSN
jgi:hypothetical protein